MVSQTHGNACHCMSVARSYCDSNPMLVLIADDDPSFCSFVLQTLEGTEFEGHEVTSDPSALAQSDALVIVGGSFAREGIAPHSGALVLAALGAGDDHGFELALARGADDAFFKPISPRALLDRLLVARHRLSLSRGGASSAWTCVDEVLAAKETGLIAIRGREHSGAIHCCDGGIAWADSTGREVSLSTLLGRFGIELDREVRSAVLHEARSTGRHFTKVLVEWGLVDADTVRECVRVHLAEVIAELLSDSRASALFTPYERWRASALSFHPHEVLGEMRSGLESGVNPLPASTPSRSWQHTVPSQALTTLHAVAELPGCRGATLMDRAGGRTSSVGESLDRSLAWAMVNAMTGAHSALTIEDGEMVHLARALDEQWVLVGTFSLRDSNLGLARNAMVHTCKSTYEAPESTLELKRAVGFE